MATNIFICGSWHCWDEAGKKRFQHALTADVGLRCQYFFPQTFVLVKYPNIFGQKCLVCTTPAFKKKKVHLVCDWNKKTIWKLRVFQKPGLGAIWSCPISECCPTIAFSVGSDSDKVCDSLNLNLGPFTGNWEAWSDLTWMLPPYFRWNFAISSEIRGMRV